MRDSVIHGGWVLRGQKIAQRLKVTRPICEYDESRWSWARFPDRAQVSCVNFRDKAWRIPYHPECGRGIVRAASNTMTTSASSPIAWEPLTPRGVASFARASLGRLLVVQLVFGLLAAAAVVWFLSDGWFPTVREAIRQLPSDGSIHGGRLDWRGDSPRLLAEGSLLALSVDLKHLGDIRSPAQVQIEFGQNSVYIYSLFGYTELRYPKGWVIALNRNDLEPWWGAWELTILCAAFAAVVAGLMVSWAIIATVYWLPAWVVAYYGNRELTLWGGWRLAGAALMPGALLLTTSILFFDFDVLDLVRLAVAAGAHLMLGWIYLFVSPMFLPRIPEAAAIRRNPFKSSNGSGTR